MSDFETFKKELSSKEEPYRLLTGKKVSDKEYNMLIRSGISLK